MEQRYLGPSAKERLFWRARFAVPRGLTPWPDDDFVGELSRMLNLEYQLQFWQQQTHPPLLLLDGELESAKDRAFLAKLFDRIKSSVSYRTIPCADHYLNTTGLGRLVIYDSRAFESCLQWIVDWILGEASPSVEFELPVSKGKQYI